jgi:flap endonuclease-1
MGVDLGDLAVKHAVTLESLSGKILAVDAFNVIYQFLSSIRQEDGTPLMDFKGRITAHLSGLFYRTSKLVQNGIKPVFVFDGPPSEFKEKTKQMRAEVKRKAEEKWRAALDEGRMKDAKMYASATSRLTGEMIEESKVLLTGMGIPFVQALSEGEAQASVMVQKGIAYATASQDYDALLFGSPVMLRNLNISGRRKVPRQDRYVMVEPEEIALRETLESLGINRDKLIWVGLLVGTDFNEGVPRVGPKTALKIVKEVPTFSELQKMVKEKYDYEFEIEPERLIDFFLNPPYAEISERPRWGNPNPEAVKKILVEEHDFAAERVEKTLTDLALAHKEKGAQKKLGDWFQ